MKKKYKSEALMVIHQDATALHRIGAISAERLREFDGMCLTGTQETIPETTQKQPVVPAYAGSNT
jgi:DNA-binding transcriptional regulator YiaG